MGRRKAPVEEEYCSFCYKSAQEVERLLAGPAGVNICNECIQVCYDIIHSQDNSETPNKTTGRKKSIKSLPAPQKIREKLDEYVIGHDETKKVLSVAVFNHYLRIQHQHSGNEEVEIEKSNIILLGDTGTGKTLLARTLSRIVDVPFAVADATTLTEAGYVGEDVENILLKLIQAADGDIAKAETGIIFIDEIDKISRRSENRSITRDVSGEGVQQALLKILEGTTASVPPQGGRKHPEQQNLKIHTNNILFICGGAFDGLDDIITKRIGHQEIGFSSKDKAKLEQEKANPLIHVEPDDIIRYGLIPELTGRLPVMGVLDKLTKDSFFQILQEPKNSLVKQYIAQYKLMGIKLKFSKNFLSLVVDEAYEKKLGVRALRSIMEKYITPLTYEVANMGKKITNITIHEGLITEGAMSVIESNKTNNRGDDNSEKLSEVS
jgi:ATP-dependent Clp protease ATP-binding subunit ClpX